MPNLDGIKKLSKEEVDKSRNIILDLIGDGKKSKQAAAIPSSQPVKMDSIATAMAKTKPAAITPPSVEKKTIPIVPVTVRPKTKDDRDEIWEKFRAAESKMKAMQTAEEREFYSAVERNKIFGKFKNQENSQKENDKPKSVEVPIIKNSETKKRVMPEKISKNKKYAEEREKKARTKKMQKSIKSEEDIIRMREKRKNLLIKALRALKIFARTLLKLFIAAIVVYIVVSILLVKFNFDNIIARQINEFIPIPAIISPIGVIDYYQYKKILESESGNSNLTNNIHRIIVQSILLEHLANQNGYTSQDLKNRRNETLSLLNEAVLKDPEINNVALKRIEKIKAMADSTQSLSEVKKFSDDYIFGGYLKKEEMTIKFGEKALIQPLNKISEVINRGDGYYILQIFEQFENTYGINYVFIKGRTLNNYLDDETDKLKIWSFI